MLRSYNLITIMMILLLNGCSSTGNDMSTNSRHKYSNEQLLISSGNHQELIKLYKQQFLDKDSDETRMKLVRSYIETKDFESAIFYIQPLIDSEAVSADAYFLYGKAKFGLNEYDQASMALNKAIVIDPNHGEALNLLGVLAAYQNNYVLARQRFVQAREKMIDDVKIKNNLAMVDLIDGHYQAAVEKLIPLLSLPEPSVKVKSNLAFAYAKLGMFDQFERLLSDSNLTQSDTKNIFQQLIKIELKEFEGPPEFLAADSERMN